MAKTSGSTIYLVQGDTLQALITLKYPDGTIYEPEENDRLRFALKVDIEDESPLIVKEIPTDTMTLELTSEETDLEVGQYVYDIELSIGDYVNTVIPNAKMIICAEVH